MAAEVLYLWSLWKCEAPWPTSRVEPSKPADWKLWFTLFIMFHDLNLTDNNLCYMIFPVSFSAWLSTLRRPIKHKTIIEKKNKKELNYNDKKIWTRSNVFHMVSCPSIHSLKCRRMGAIAKGTKRCTARARQSWHFCDLKEIHNSGLETADETHGRWLCAFIL